MVTEGDRSNEVARRRAHMPEGTGAILDARALATDHRRLAALLRPGLAVLDVRCGTGAITRGIAEAVGRQGRAVGVDVNASMIEKARGAHRGMPGLSFEVADVHALPGGGFDIVTAARALQWLAEPAAALRRMAEAARPGGRVVVLDFNHEKAVWKPEPPRAATRGHQTVADGAISEAERRAAETDYRAWLRDGAESHVLYLRAVEGVRA
jgi:ubiquinone/menaquinone biosynthesis C-methylase UbiE